MSVPRRDVADEPYLSVVVTSRNDDHGGDMLRRMQIFLDAWFEQVARHRLRAEMIIVEWNPPPNRSRLVEVLRWPQFATPGSGRIIVVPPEIHARYRCSDRLGLLQMVAKNVGIRRARGQFILCTNVDLLFSDDLMAFLAAEQLDHDCMYRIDRVDIDSNVPIGVSVIQQLEYCQRHVMRINTRWGTFAAGERWWVAIAERAWRSTIRGPIRRQTQRLWDGFGYTTRSLRTACIRMVRDARASLNSVVDWLRPGGTLQRKARGILTRRRLHMLVLPLAMTMRQLKREPITIRRARRIARHVAKRARAVGGYMLSRGMARTRLAALPISTLLLRRAPAAWGQIVAYIAGARIDLRSAMEEQIRTWRQELQTTAIRLRDTIKPLHTNACGDFTLLDRESWFSLRGYPEWDMFSIHIDSVFCQMAVHAGAREVMLNSRMRLYHLEHGAGWSPGEAERVIQRIQRIGVRFLEMARYQELVGEMRRRRGPLVFNDENWGLVADRFEEINPLGEREQAERISRPPDRETAQL